jgi:hypothetical protein
MILGTEPVTAGKLSVGASVVASHVDQSRDSLNPNRTVFEEIADGAETLDLGGRYYGSSDKGTGNGRAWGCSLRQMGRGRWSICRTTQC